MIYNKNILHLNKGGISTDTRKILHGQCPMIHCYYCSLPWNSLNKIIRKCYFIDVFIEEDRLNTVKAYLDMGPSKYTT